MERICRLLNQALTPYQAELGPVNASQQRQLTLLDSQGGVTLQCAVSLRQLEEQSLLIDLVDGLRRDLQIAEGRLQPCVIAALQHQQHTHGTFA